MSWIKFFAIVCAGFALAVFSPDVMAQASKVIEDTLRQLPPEVALPIRKQINEDRTRVQRDFDLMNQYHDLVVNGRATGQDTNACRTAEADAVQYKDSIVALYQSDRNNIASALRIQIAAEVEEALTATNPCPDQAAYNSLGKNSFTSGEAR